MEAWLLAQKAQIDAVNAEIQGMIAENQRRVSQDEAQAYPEAAFQEKAQEFYGIYNDIMANR